uniref:Choline/carnitine acyltransferase domain-containing protein n=1 Tax=Hemiselmis andersenii TaxID=464988 RepID=A0A7S1GU14_HEMAN|mmetsp:Transcript_15233/g.36912  ORF Transcript_15233/g.36912 Transcript_15233/m.36912 type:complete len:401 (+) Transcript_15233:188-1390(+)
MPSEGAVSTADNIDDEKSSMDARLAQALSILSEQEAAQMLGNQDNLPRLPIPSLSDSVSDFLRACEPQLSPEEYAETERSCKTFLENPEEGQKLHQALLDYDRQEGKNSYLEEFWETAYLAQRTPIPINTNPFFVLEDDPTPARTSQIARATNLVWSSLKFYCSVRDGTLEPDMQRTTPLCMTQYTRLFGTARIPGKGVDTVSYNPDSRHIVVMSRGHVYWMDVLGEDGKVCLSQTQIEEALRSIRTDSLRYYIGENLNQAVGLLTTENREEWAVRREKLRLASGENASSLQRIDSAIFVLCLDDTSPSSQAETASNSLHGTSELAAAEGYAAGVQVGTCINRWYDKSLSIIVCQNGAAGINFEHSVIDGHSVLRFASDVFTDTILTFAENIRDRLTCAA